MNRCSATQEQQHETQRKTQTNHFKQILAAQNMAELLPALIINKQGKAQNGLDGEELRAHISSRFSADLNHLLDNKMAVQAALNQALAWAKERVFNANRTGEWNKAHTQMIWRSCGLPNQLI